LWRAPVLNTPLWGWNARSARKINVPTLIIAGDLDTLTGVTVGRNLYSDLVTDSKVFVHVACAGHQLVWENQHRVLLEEEVKARLRVRAARQGHSLEEEARVILRVAVAGEPQTPRNLAEAIRKRFRKLGGVDLPVILREPVRSPPFEK